jgi:acyl-CoA synthetase (AMP-forming)/AMP-acid ligase II
MAVNIVEILMQQAEIRGDAVALADRKRGQRRALTFAELAAATAAGSRLLLRSGLKRGDTILFFHPVAIELYTALLSALRAGMVAMFVDPSAGRKLMSRCCELAQPAGLFGSPKAHLLRLLSRGVRRCPVKFSTGVSLPSARRWDPGVCYEQVRVAEVDDDTPALITFTSGSTGRPKGMVRSHGFLIAQHRALQSALSLEPGQVDLITLPVFVLANLASGVTSVLADTDLAKPGRADADAVGAQAQDEGVTRVAASPAFLGRLLDRPRCLNSFDQIYTGGAPVFPPLLDALKKAKPSANVFAVFGSSEAEPIAHIEHGEVSEQDRVAMRKGEGLLVGTPVAEIQLRVVQDTWGTPLGAMSGAEFDEKTCKRREPGEIVVTGDHVLKGYLHGIGDEETKFRVNDEIWHRTGDAGYLDERGRLWLLGRCSARTTVAGTSLYPFAVEAALSFDSAVRRSAVATANGRALLAVELSPAARPEMDLPRIKEAIGWSGLLEEIVQVPVIPVDRRHNAKVDYPALEKMLDR